MNKNKMRGVTDVGGAGDITVINAGTLKESLNYLVCPKDEEELKLDIPKKDRISEGEFCCRKCNTVYPIKNGISYFFEKGNGFEWNPKTREDLIVKSLAKTLDDKTLTWSKMLALGPLFYNHFSDKKTAIDHLFTLSMNLVRGKNSETKVYVTQAATAVRYDIENYRGTFTLPKKITEFLSKNYGPYSTKPDYQGAILEGACATGECLFELLKNLFPISEKNKTPKGLGIGIDISGSMIRKAQKKVPEYLKKYLLFIQGTIGSLPIKKDSVGIYILNNAFDRVLNPINICVQANQVLLKRSGVFVLSNCDPLQFSYTSVSGEKIIFVPKEKRINLEEGLDLARCRKVIEQTGMWNIETIAYGREVLSYKSLAGVRK